MGKKGTRIVMTIETPQGGTRTVREDASGIIALRVRVYWPTWPKSLEGWVDLVNSIPPSRQLPSFENILGKKHVSALQEMIRRDVITDFEKPPSRRKLRKQLPILLNGLPDEFIYNNEPREYVQFRNARILLHQIAQHGHEANGSRWEEDLSYEEMKYGRFGQQIYFRVDADTGRFRIIDGIGSLIEVLKITGVQKLGECPVCFKLFLKKRKDSSTCHPRCGNTLRQRRYKQGQAEEDREFEESEKTKLTRRRK